MFKKTQTPAPCYTKWLILVIYGIFLSTCQYDKAEQLPFHYLPFDGKWSLDLTDVSVLGDTSTYNGLKYLEVPLSEWLPLFSMVSKQEGKAFLVGINASPSRHLLVAQLENTSLKAPSFFAAVGIDTFATFDFKGINIYQGQQTDQKWIFAQKGDFYLFGRQAADVEGTLDRMNTSSISEEWRVFTDLRTQKPKVSVPSLYTSNAEKLFPKGNIDIKGTRLEVVPKGEWVYLEGNFVSERKARNKNGQVLTDLLGSLPLIVEQCYAQSNLGQIYSAHADAFWINSDYWVQGQFVAGRRFMLFPKVSVVSSNAPVLQQGIYQSFEWQQSLDTWEVPGSAPFVNPFWCQTDQYLLVFESLIDLKLWLDYHIVGKSLLDDEFLMAEIAPFLSYWTDFYLDRRVLAGELADQPYARVAQAKKVSEQYQYRSKWIALPAEAQQALQLTWRLELAGSIIQGPFAVANTNKWAVQDSTFLLQVGNWAGEVLTQKRLDGPLLSEVFWIPQANGGAYAFNTRSSLYLLDTLGQAINGFPISIPAGASASMHVLNWDENGEFQFFVPTNQARILAYTNTAQPIPKWNPKVDTATIDFPILHVVQPTQDWIIAFNQKGQLRTFGRDGRMLWARDLKGQFRQAPIVQRAAGYDRIVVVDTAGFANIVPFDTLQAPFRTFLELKGDAPLHYLFEPLLGDERYDYILLKSKQVKAYSYIGRQLNKAWEVQEIHAFDQLFSLAHPILKGFGVVDALNEQLHVYDGQGKLLSGFPVKGDRPLVLDSSGTRWLVGLGEQLFMYER